MGEGKLWPFTCLEVSLSALLLNELALKFQMVNDFRFTTLEGLSVKIHVYWPHRRSVHFSLLTQLFLSSSQASFWILSLSSVFRNFKNLGLVVGVFPLVCCSAHLWTLLVW